jgi:hypothetical protein
MVKDKVIQMENGENYYILEEVEYNNRKYAFCLQCDLNEDKLNEDDYFVVEICLDDENISIKNIENDELAKTVSTLLLQKIQKN